jgi:hypothetical protein
MLENARIDQLFEEPLLARNQACFISGTALSIIIMPYFK